MHPLVFEKLRFFAEEFTLVKPIQKVVNPRIFLRNTIIERCFADMILLFGTLIELKKESILKKMLSVSQDTS